MTKPITLASLLLATTILCAPAALAQSTTTGETPVVTEGQSQSPANVPSGQPGDQLPPQESPPANIYFRDGEPLTGQSDHLANVQVGLENTDRLSQQTLLLTYASKRVTARGPSGQPDLYEYPGLVLDFVAREGFKVAGRDIEIKFEARNLTARKYKEYQESGDNRVYFNRYKVGTTVALGGSMKF